MHIVAEFGEILRRIRKERNLSLDALAEKVGTSKQVISRYEKGERIPKISAVQKLANALGVSVYELAGESAKPVTPDMVRDITADEYWAWREDLRRNPEKRTMFDLTKNASRSQMREINAFIRGLRTSNDYEEDPD